MDGGAVPCTLLLWCDGLTSSSLEPNPRVLFHCQLASISSKEDNNTLQSLYQRVSLNTTIKTIQNLSILILTPINNTYHHTSLPGHIHGIQKGERLKMEEWRSAVDEKTGRTYWYHRITRESTWTKPKCFEQSHNSGTGGGRPISNNSQGYEILLQMLEGLGNPDVLVELLHENSPDLQEEAVQLFLSCCIPSTVYFLAKEPGAIDGLVKIIMLTSTSIPTRRNALRSLCSLALQPSTMEFFLTSQGWISLAVHFMKWPDIESTILFIILICLLLSGKARSLITKDIILLLKQFLDHNCPYSADKYGQLPQSLQLSAFDTHPSSQGVSLLDGSVLTQFAGKLNIIGGELPGTVLVTLAGHCLREERYSSIFISKGGINALQFLCGSSSTISNSLKDQGCELLAASLEFSPLLRRRIVDMWTAMASDLFLTSEVHGFDPLRIKVDGEPAVDIHRDVELRPRGSSQNTVWRVCSSILWARCPGMRNVLNDFWKGQQSGNRAMYQGGLEISVDASEEVLTLLVHYIHTGLLPSLSSSYPPLLSHIIAATDAIELDEPSLSATAILFELCRISTELQMTHLEHISIQQYCEICHLYFLSIDPSTSDTDDIQTSRVVYLQSVLRMCEKYMLERLHVNVMFLLEYGYPLHITEEKISVKGVSALNGIDFDSPTGLRRAISESVTDVTTILNHDAESHNHSYYTYHEDEVDNRESPPRAKKTPILNPQTSPKPATTKRSGTSKKAKPTGGGIYKLLLQETGSGHGENGFGTEVDSSLLESSSHSNDDTSDIHPRGYYDLPGGAPILLNERSKKDTSAGGRKGKTLNVEEFIRSQHSLAPPAQSKMTPSQKRLEEISKPKQTKTPFKGRGSVKKVTTSVEESAESLGEIIEASQADVEIPPEKVAGKVPEKKTPNRPVNKKPTQKTEKKPNPVPQPTIQIDPQEIGITPEFSQSPVIKDDKSNSSTTTELNESVKASLQLLKKKPRSRFGRGTSVSESVDGSEAGTTSRYSPDLLPSNLPEKADQPQLPVRSSSTPRPVSAPQPSRKPLPARKPMSAPATCTRTSDCTCSLCVIPVDELPIVESIPPKLSHHSDDEDKIGASRMTTLMKSRLERNKQPEIKKKDSKSAVWKRQSNQLRQAIASARAATNGTPLPASDPLEKVDDGLVPCPHCSRRFNHDTAQRHIPICKKTKSKPTTLRKGSGLGGGVGGGGGGGSISAGRR